MGSAIDIKAVTAQIAQGDEASFELLYRTLVDAVFSYVSYRVTVRETALELTQDCFIELHRSLHSFTYQSDAAFYGFLFTIVKRQLAKHYADAKRRTVSEFDEEHHVTSAVSPETTIGVRVALEQLDEISREIVVLHHWSRHTFAEIATIMSMTESAVRVRHHRACASLRNTLT